MHSNRTTILIAVAFAVFALAGWVVLQPHTPDTDSVRGRLRVSGPSAMGQAMAELADEAKAQIQGGIGIGVSKDSPSGWLRVMTVLPNSPALAAGLKPGDLISEIDGKSLAALPLPDAVTRMRGIKLTTVTLTIRHDGSTNFEHAVIRRVSFKQVMQLSTGQR